MIFQTLDDKGSCVGIYRDGELIINSLPEDLSATWNYAQFLKHQNIEYARLYCEGQSLKSVCPELLLEDFENITKKLKAYLRSFKLGKISLNDHCFFDLVPEGFLLEYCEIKNKITEHVLKTHEKPKNYDFLLDLTKHVSEIESQKLNIDLTTARSSIIAKRGKQAFIKYKQYEPFCKYEIFGTKTGRLINKPGTFPILTMEKDFRVIVKPTIDWFVELDYNGAELRTVLALSDKEQPQGDIHKWNAKNIYDNCSREEAKGKIFAWLYNSSATHKRAESLYNREQIRDQYWDGESVRTRYGRTIVADKHHSLPYIVQSALSDTLLRQMIKVSKFLENHKSFVAFCVHDSIVLDMADDEKYLIPQIKKIFAQNDLAEFEVNIKAGKSFGKLYNLKL